MRVIRNAIDAIAPIRLTIKPCDAKTATKKSFTNCLIAVAFKRSYGAKWVEVFNNTVYVKFEDKTIRYQSTPRAKTLVAAYDMDFATIPPEGVQIILNVPRKTQSLSYQRSPEFKKARQESAVRSRVARKNGKTPRPYMQSDALTLQDVRNGNFRREAK